MGRELRKVPANWEHPKKEDGTWQPMFDEFYLDALEEWLTNHKSWMDGTHQNLKDDPSLKEMYPFYAMYGGDPPDVDYYQTRKFQPEELTHIQLYESTTEGTPISPVFKADELDKLCEWAANNATTFGSYKTTKENWMKMLNDGLVYHQDGNAIFL